MLLVLLFLNGLPELVAYELLLVIVTMAVIGRLRAPAPPPFRPGGWGRPARGGDRLLPAQLAVIERTVGFGRTTAFDAEHRLLPLLSSLAAVELEARRGIDLAAQPEAAAAALGDAAWAVVRPDRAPEADRLGPGLPVEDVRAVVAAVESL